MKPESLEVSLTKLILVVSIMVSLGAILGAIGYLTKNRQVARSLLQVSITPEPTATAVPIIKDETADWKIYRNEEYGFEARYPLNWKIYGTNTDSNIDVMSYNLYDPEFEFGNSNGVKIQIQEQSFSQITSLDKFMPIIDDLTGKNLKIEKAALNGNEARKAAMNGAIVYFLISKDGKTGVRIFVWKGNNENTNKIADQILSTFKFIDKDSSFSCGNGTVTDIDYNIYNTVKIGEQCWLKENLKVTKNPVGKAITRYCYDNNPKICETDGGLYDWNTAMNGSIVEGSQGICPNGWHMPKDSEWYVLEKGLAIWTSHYETALNMV